jgi:hypothetical protein
MIVVCAAADEDAAAVAAVDAEAGSSGATAADLLVLRFVISADGRSSIRAQRDSKPNVSEA